MVERDQSLKVRAAGFEAGEEPGQPPLTAAGGPSYQKCRSVDCSGTHSGNQMGSGWYCVRTTANRYAVDTESQVGFDNLEFDGSRGFDYAPTSWLRLLCIYRLLRAVLIGRDDAFLDLGGGKGRVLMVASRFPLRRLIGVDLSPSPLRLEEQLEYPADVGYV